LIERLIAELRALPRVQSAATPTQGRCWGSSIPSARSFPQGRTPGEMRGNPDNPQIRAVSHDYLQTMGERLIAGRFFDARDDAAAPPVIDRQPSRRAATVRQREPGGTLVHLDGRMEFAPQQIVGVVEDMRQGPARSGTGATDVRRLPPGSGADAGRARCRPAVQERLASGFSRSSSAPLASRRS
jgi:hypothetical protein